MPTYEYECKSCGHSFEAFQSMKEAALTSCPECGQAVRRMINGGMGIIFKGSGFYVTDNGGGKGRPSSEKSSDKASSSSASTSGSTASTTPTPSACANCPKADSSSASKEKAAG